MFKSPCFFMDIDLVIPWVDGSDPIWLEEKNKYLKYKRKDNGFYQDWGWMRYWFRCIEKNMPWIRYVFFITYGHVPEWLNVNHEKLKIVNHKDYLLPEFLPTFSCNPINMNLHRIEELSEFFIYAEDDIFFLGKQNATDYFSAEGLPKDFLWICPLTEQFTGDFAHNMLNNLLVINRHLGMKEQREQIKPVLFAEEYPQCIRDDNNRYSGLKKLPGIKETHLAYAFRKSTFNEVWDKEGMYLYESSMHRFRTIADPTICLMREWQLLSGKISPYFPKDRYYTDTADSKLKELIISKDTSILCINESDKKEYSEEFAAEIGSYFEQRFPDKSSFEI